MERSPGPFATNFKQVVSLPSVSQELSSSLQATGWRPNVAIEALKQMYVGKPTLQALQPYHESNRSLASMTLNIYRFLSY